MSQRAAARGSCLRVIIATSAALLACGPPRTPPAAPLAEHDAIRLPNDVAGVLEVDAAQLRASALWYPARRAYEAASPLIAACPGVLGEVAHVSIAAHLPHPGASAPDAIYHVLRGVDTAHVRACLASRDAVRAAPRQRVASRAGDGLPRECQRFDAAVHELAACAMTPASMQRELVELRAALLSDDRSSVAASCQRAADIVARANQRRSALEGACHVGDDRAAAQRIDDRTFQLGDEIVYLADAHTVVAIRAAGAVDRLRALRTAPRAARWYDVERRGAPALWLALDADQLREPHADAAPSAPTRVFGALTLRGDLALDLALHGASQDKHWFSLLRAMRGAAALGIPLEQLAPHATCIGPAPTGPRAQRCHAAATRAAALVGEASRAERNPIMTAVDALELDSTTAWCAESTASDAYLACVERATKATEIWPCVSGDPARAPVCGARGASIGLALPLRTLEALKLHEITARAPTRDCRAHPPRAPWAFALSERAAEVCFTAEDCWRVAPRAAATWEASPAPTTCAGPINFVGTKPARVGCHAANPISLRVEPRALQLCTEARCAALHPDGDLAQVSTDARARWAAIVTGPRGAQAIETWDVDAKRRIARFVPATTPARPCVGVQLLDDTLLITTGACNSILGPAQYADIDPELDISGTPRPRDLLATATDAYFATLDGKRIAPVDPDLAVDWPRRLTARRWAFATASGDGLRIYDVATGQVVQRFATGAPIEPDYLAVATTGTHVAIAYTGKSARAGTVAIVDVATGALTTIAGAPPCAEP